MKAVSQRVVFKIAFAFAAALLPLLVLILWGFRENVRVSEERILRNLSLTADAVAAQVDETFDAAVGLAWAVAGDPFCETRESAELDRHLSQLVKKTPLFETVAVFDIQGRNRGWGNRSPVVQRPDISGMEFFQNVIGTNGPVISEVTRVWGGDSDFGVVAAVPIRDASGKVEGVVVVILQPGQLAKWYMENRLQAGQSVFLVDREGRMAFHSDVRQLSFEQSGSFRNFQAVRWALSGISQMEARYLSPLFHDIRMGAFVPTRGYQWAVGVSIPRAIALAPVKANLARQLLGFAGVLLLSVGIVGILAKHLTSPLGRLQAYARALGQGDLSRRVKLTTGDEFEDLGDAFNDMAQQMEERDANLRKTQERFRITFEQAAVGIAHVALDGRWLRVNDRLCTILGYSREELLQMKFWDITPSPDKPRDEEAIERASGGEPRGMTFEKRFFRKDQSMVWVNVTLARARNLERAEPPYFIKVVEDISHRKQMEADREELLRKERSARAAAETAIRTKDQFVAVVSHELRSPLTPALAAVDLMENASNLSPEQVENLRIIRGNIEMESRLISDLLDLTRIQQAKFELHLQTVDVHGLLREVASFFSTEIREKGLAVEFEFFAEPHELLADPGRLRQVFWNLLGNAVKFTGDGGRILFRSSVREGRLHIEVCDTGIGIAPEIISQVFEAFRQGEHTISRRYGGMGLGLTISKALVESHGGQISVASKIGEGTVFTVELPLPPVTAPRVEPPRPIESGAAQQSPRRILLVEDNVEALRMLARLLERAGHTVTQAKSAAEALEAARKAGVDLLISDIGLPDSTGWDLFRELRKTCPEAQGIAMSGFGTPEDIERSREAGYSGHLIKPIDYKLLKKLIEQMTGWL